jgi:hypothetical protein
MRLAPFIREKERPIVEHWETFARTLVPASDDMSPQTLRNHIKDILAFIADDIESSQTDSEQEKNQKKKSLGIPSIAQRKFTPLSANPAVLPWTKWFRSSEHFVPA